MKNNLNILLLIVVIAGLINVVLGVFIMEVQYLIVSGCLLIAIGAGWNYRNGKKDHPRNTAI